MNMVQTEEAEWLRDVDVKQVVGTVVIGLLILYIGYAFSHARRRTGKGIVKTLVIQAHASGSDRKEEYRRDFMRNLKSTWLLTHDGTYPILEAFSHECAEAVRSGNVNRDITNQVLEQFIGVLKEVYPEADNPLDVAERIIKHVTVTPSVEILLEENLVPPSMSQARYTIALCSNGAVHVLTNGFVGANVMGPPDPNFKFTDRHLQIVSEDLARDSGSKGGLIKYAITRTSAKLINDAINQQDLLECAQNESLWDSYL